MLINIFVPFPDKLISQIKMDFEEEDYDEQHHVERQNKLCFICKETVEFDQDGNPVYTSRKCQTQIKKYLGQAVEATINSDITSNNLCKTCHTLIYIQLPRYETIKKQKKDANKFNEFSQKIKDRLKTWQPHSNTQCDICERFFTPKKARLSQPSPSTHKRKSTYEQSGGSCAKRLSDCYKKTETESETVQEV